MTRNNINWLAKVFPSYAVLFIPKKEDMEKLLPKPLHPRWEITKCHNLSDGGYSVTLGHINPLPFELREFYNALAENPWVGVQKAEELSKQMQEVAALTGVDMTPAGGKHDYYGNLSITGYPDEQTAREFFESYKVISTSGFKVPGTTIDISLGDLIETFAPKELAKEAKKAMDEFDKGISQLSTMGAKYENGKFLGEEALFISKGEEKVCQAILINNFIITGDILGYSKLPSGKKRSIPLSARLHRGVTESQDQVYSSGTAVEGS